MLGVNRLNTKNFGTIRRSLSTLNIAVIGSGPSGFYTAVDLLKQSSIPINVTVFEKLPTPFGLSRYGVSPDHLEVKNCEDTFNSIVTSPHFKFVGGVEVGKDIDLKQIRENFNGIVFAYGNSKENLLGIKGEDSPGVINAKDFVGWYNGNVETKHINPDLSQVKTVTIIGNGNVAMDIARLLLMPYEELKHSDIMNNALAQLKHSKVENVKIVARRGLLESAFATKEIRELLELEEFAVKFDGLSSDVVEFVRPFIKKLERVKKRKIETIEKFMLPIEERKTKYPIPASFNKHWSLEYLKSPVEILTNPTNSNLLKSVKFQENQLVLKPDQYPTVEPIPDKYVDIETDLLITSTGFKGVPIPGLDSLGAEFDAKRGVIQNANSRLFNKSGLIHGLYTTGWIKNHSKGPIVNTLIDSNTVVQSILEDFGHGKYQELKGVEGLTVDKKVLDWKDWETLNQFELKFGELNGKTRWKVPTLELMNEIINDESSIEEKLIKFEKPLKEYK